MSEPLMIQHTGRMALKKSMCVSCAKLLQWSKKNKLFKIISLASKHQFKEGEHHMSQTKIQRVLQTMDLKAIHIFQCLIV